MLTSSLTLRLEIELIANDCWASGSGVGTCRFACSHEFLLLGFRWGQLNDRLQARSCRLRNRSRNRIWVKAAHRQFRSDRSVGDKQFVPLHRVFWLNT